MQIKIGRPVVDIRLCHLGSSNWEPVLVWVLALHREEIAEYRNRFRGHLMMSFSVVIWEIGIGAVVVTRVACFLGIVIPYFISNVNKSHLE